MSWKAANGETNQDLTRYCGLDSQTPETGDSENAELDSVSG